MSSTTPSSTLTDHWNTPPNGRQRTPRTRETNKSGLRSAMVTTPTVASICVKVLTSTQTQISRHVPTIHPKATSVENDSILSIATSLIRPRPLPHRTHHPHLPHRPVHRRCPMDHHPSPSGRSPARSTHRVRSHITSSAKGWLCGVSKRDRKRTHSLPKYEALPSWSMGRVLWGLDPHKFTIRTRRHARGSAH